MNNTGMIQRRRGLDSSPVDTEEISTSTDMELGGSTKSLDPKSNPSLQNVLNRERNRSGGYFSEVEGPALTLVEQVFLLGLKDQQGYLSFLNDTISYILRGCIIMELSFKGKIRTIKDISRRHPAERALEVIDATPTGDSLLDEALKHMKSEKHSVAGWIDLLSGETWNPMKSHFQLKQVRERVAKGLVDKGVLRTDMKSFMLFDMATHPISDSGVKKNLISKIIDVLVGSSSSQPDLKMIALTTSALAGNVMGSVLNQLPFAQRDVARSKAETWLREYCYEEKSRNDIVSAVLSVFLRMDSLLY